ncbi:MAG TPA: M23 family metallopeptidase, partial [Anaerolineae bacterium]|nr:M23 family metallopeptidase [Anaerolineae bacterium]
LTITTPGQPAWRQPWHMTRNEWTWEEITLTGTAAAIDQAAIDAERAQLFELWNQKTPVPLWDTPFQPPIDQYLQYSSLYGARRSYNGGPYRTYHEGVDYSAYGGTPVYAPAAGTVVVAEQLYVRGGAVIIDHGLGLYTGFYHLSEILVEPNSTVTPGQQIGAVGTTGLSTGNHLHWDFLVNGTWIDALSWQEQQLATWLLTAWNAPYPPNSHTD